MPDLETRLTDLGEWIEWPVTPVLLPLHAEPAREERRGAAWKSRWPLAAAAVFLVAATLVAYTPTREAIAGWLNLHTTINRVEHPPTPSPLPSGPAGARLQLGEQTTLAAAQALVAWKIGVPAALGAPDEVYVKLPPAGPSQGMVTLVYAPRAGIAASGVTGVAVLVTEARGRVDEQFFGKTLGPDVSIEQVSVDGKPGYWISGRPHAFVFVAADGAPYYDSLRLAANTLVFDDGGTVVRIEGDLAKQHAIDIGRSLA